MVCPVLPNVVPLPAVVRVDRALRHCRSFKWLQNRFRYVVLLFSCFNGKRFNELKYCVTAASFLVKNMTSIASPHFPGNFYGQGKSHTS